MPNAILQSKDILTAHHVRKIVSYLREIAEKMRLQKYSALSNNVPRLKNPAAVLKKANIPAQVSKMFMPNINNARAASDFCEIVECTAHDIETYSIANGVIDVELIQYKLKSLQQILSMDKEGRLVLGMNEYEIQVRRFLEELHKTTLLPSFNVDHNQLFISMPLAIKKIAELLDKFIKEKQSSFFKSGFSKIEIQLAGETHRDIYQEWFCNPYEIDKITAILLLLVNLNNKIEKALPTTKNLFGLLKAETSDLRKISTNSLTNLMPLLLTRIDPYLAQHLFNIAKVSLENLSNKTGPIMTAFKEIALRCKKNQSSFSLNHPVGHNSNVLKFAAKILQELIDSLFKDKYTNNEPSTKLLMKTINDAKQAILSVYKKNCRPTPNAIWEKMFFSLNSNLKFLPCIDHYFDLIIKMYSFHLQLGVDEIAHEKSQTIVDWHRQNHAIGNQYYILPKEIQSTQLDTPAAHAYFMRLLSEANITNTLLINFIYVMFNQHNINFIEDYLKREVREDNSIQSVPRYDLKINFLGVQPPFYIQKIGHEGVRVCIVLQSDGMSDFNNGLLVNKDIEPTLVLYCEFYAVANSIQKGRNGVMTFNNAKLPHVARREVESDTYFLELLPEAVKNFEISIYNTIQTEVESKKTSPVS